MTTLIVRLPYLPGASAHGHPPPAELDWALTLDGQSVDTHGQALPALLPRRGGCEVVALIPAPALAWHRVTLPAGSTGRGGRQRLRAVLEGLLEEQLLDDPASQHLALAPDAGAAAGVPAWVAACDRSWLQAQLQALQNAGLRVHRIVPEQWPAEAAGPLHLLTGADARAWLVQRHGGGVLALPWEAFQALSAETRASLCPALQNPDTPLLAEPALIASAEALLTQRPVLQTPAQRWITAWQGAREQGWNLAQFDFAHAGRRSLAQQARAGLDDLWRAPRWRSTRWAGALLALTHVAGLNAWAWHEKSRQDAQRTELRQVLQQTFPKVTVVVDVPLQMAREVAALEHATGTASSQDLEMQLAALASAAPAGASITALDYTPAQLRVRGLPLGDADLAQLSARLQPHGYRVQRDNDTLSLQPAAAGTPP